MLLTARDMIIGVERRIHATLVAATYIAARRRRPALRACLMLAYTLMMLPAAMSAR